VTASTVAEPARSIEAEDPAGILLSTRTRRARHTWGCATNPETTEGDSRETSARVCRHRPTPAPQRDRAAQPGRETLEADRIENGPVTLAAELAKAGEHPEVILAATYGR
jgi:hypothetical protein